MSQHDPHTDAPDDDLAGHRAEAYEFDLPEPGREVADSMHIYQSDLGVRSRRAADEGRAEERRRLRRIWAIAQAAVARAGAESLEPHRLDHFEDWFVGRHSVTDIFAPRRASGGGPTAGPESRLAPERVYTGRADDVVLQIAAEADALDPTPAARREFMLTSVLPALRYLESTLKASPEQCVDAVLFVLARLRPIPSTPGLRSLVASLRAYLNRMPPPERQPGWWQSLAACGDLLVEPGELHGSLQGLVYYWEVLVWCRDMARTGAASPQAQPLQPEVMRLVRNCATNSINTMHDSVVVDRRNVPPETRNVTGALASLAAVMATAMTDWRPDQGLRPEDAVQSLLATGEFSANVAGVLDHMGRTPVSWAETFPGLQLALMEALAAVVRLTISARVDDVASSLFNCGVSLIREREQGRWDRGSLARARVGVNSIGFFWALTSANNVELRAMTDHHGIDCAVNMVGAATEANLPDEVRSAVLRVGAVAFAVASQIEDRMIDRVRLQNSLKELTGGNLEVISTLGEPRPVEDLFRILEWVGGTQSVPHQPDPLIVSGERTNEVIRATAEFLRGIFVSIVEGPGATMSFTAGFAEPVAATLQRVLSGVNDPRGAVVSVITAIEQEGGPIVGSRLRTRAEWQEIVSASQRPTDALAEALGMQGHLDWIDAQTRWKRGRRSTEFDAQ